MSAPLCLVLVGPHGAGKSTLGVALAAALAALWLPEVGRLRRLRALRRRRTALSRDPQFDWGVLAAELRRDLRLPRRVVVETWHPGNLAYASLRSPRVAQGFQGRLEAAVRSVPGVVVLPVTATPAALARRLREPGGRPAQRLAFFQAVADRSLAFAVRWGLPVLPPIDTSHRPPEVCVQQVLTQLDDLLRRDLLRRPDTNALTLRGLAV